MSDQDAVLSEKRKIELATRKLAPSVQRALHELRTTAKKRAGGVCSFCLMNEFGKAGTSLYGVIKLIDQEEHNTKANNDLVAVTLMNAINSTWKSSFNKTQMQNNHLKTHYFEFMGKARESVRFLKKYSEIADYLVLSMFGQMPLQETAKAFYPSPLYDTTLRTFNA